MPEGKWQNSSTVTDWCFWLKKQSSPKRVIMAKAIIDSDGKPRLAEMRSEDEFSLTIFLFLIGSALKEFFSQSSRQQSKIHAISLL